MLYVTIFVDLCFLQYLNIRFSVLQLQHVASVTSNHAVPLKVTMVVGSWDLIDSWGQLTQTKVIFILALLSRIPLQVDTSAFIRNWCCRFGDSFVPSHHAYSVLHVAVQVTKIAQLIRIRILGRPIDHRLNFLSR